jgi:uncharacterized membrane protein
MEKQIDKNTSWLYPANIYRLIIFLAIVVLCYFLIDSKLVEAINNLEDAKKSTDFLEFMQNFTNAIFTGVLVSFIFAYMQHKMHEKELNSIQDKVERNYKNVLAAAELLQNSRKNNGLAGITDSPEEQNIFTELAASSFTADNAPTIWWHNFRIEQYDTFKRSIEEFVKQGGNVHLITTHPYNPNIEFRLNEAYHDKEIDDYRQHFFLQANTFIQLEEQLKSQKNIGTFNVYFNKNGTPGVPIFIVYQDLDFRAYTGFYLNEISGTAPYIIWETAGEGMVKKFKDYVIYKMNNSLNSQEMKNELLNTNNTLEDE